MRSANRVFYTEEKTNRREKKEGMYDVYPVIYVNDKYDIHLIFLHLSKGDSPNTHPHFVLTYDVRHHVVSLES